MHPSGAEMQSVKCHVAAAGVSHLRQLPLLHLLLLCWLLLPAGPAVLL
jgi:hypothetical protein